jgi:hypothetical protein
MDFRCLRLSTSFRFDLNNTRNMRYEYTTIHMSLNMLLVHTGSITRCGVGAKFSLLDVTCSDGPPRLAPRARLGAGNGSDTCRGLAFAATEILLLTVRLLDRRAEETAAAAGAPDTVVTAVG